MRATQFQLATSIFKAYDIRGVVATALTPNAVRAIGAAYGSQAMELGVAVACVGRDGRLSGPLLRDALIEGLRSTGLSVIDIGMVPTPVLYFATHHLKTGSGCRDHRQPQPARVQRPEDDAGRRYACTATAFRQSGSASRAGGCVAARNPGRWRAGRCGRGVSGAHHWRRQACTADEDCDRLRQRGGRARSPRNCIVRSAARSSNSSARSTALFPIIIPIPRIPRICRI